MEEDIKGERIDIISREQYIHRSDSSEEVPPSLHVRSRDMEHIHTSIEFYKFAVFLLLSFPFLRRIFGTA